MIVKLQKKAVRPEDVPIFHGCAFGVIAADVFVGRSALSGLITPTYHASTFVWGLAFALGVGVLGALYPTWRAVRLTPIEALRHE